MFRIECFCDDKNLAKLKWALHDLGAYNVTDQPVKDARSNGAYNSQHHIPKEELSDSFLAYARRHGLNKGFQAKQAKEFVTSVGYSLKSYSHVLGVLKKAGVIKRDPKKIGTFNAAWLVVPKPTKPTKKKAKKESAA